MEITKEILESLGMTQEEFEREKKVVEEIYGVKEE